MSYKVADYIIERLTQNEAERLFGVPSVYCARLFQAAVDAKDFEPIVTSSDLEAGYAADGYARVRGLAAVAVSYGPGTLSLVNAIAGAYVERSPVVVINGGPSNSMIAEQAETGIVFSHSIGKPHTDLDVFRPVTSFCERVDTLSAVPAKVDEAIRAALTLKRPAYLEIPQSFFNEDCPRPTGLISKKVPAGAASKCSARILQAIRNATKPLLVVGVEVHRYGVASEVLSLINKLQVPWITTVLDKTTLDEQHPNFVGVFGGALAKPIVRKAVQDADLILSLGAIFGTSHKNLMAPKRHKTIRLWDGKAHFLTNANPETAGFEELIKLLERDAPMTNLLRSRQENDVDGLTADVVTEEGDPDAPSWLPDANTPRPSPPPGNGMTYDDLFSVVEKEIASDPRYHVVADTFLGIYPSANLRMSGKDSFTAGAIWASIGHSVAAAVGISAAGLKRPLVICGDGGFQMTVQSLSTMARFNLNPIVLIVDNGLYGYEQWLLDKRFYSGGPALPYAVIGRWDYVGIATAMGIGVAARATTVADLSAAIAAAKKQSSATVIQVIVAPRSLPSGL